MENIVREGEIACKKQFLLISQCFLPYMAFYFSFELITRGQILDSSKLKDFADDNFKFDENSRKLFKPVENTMGKGEIAQ